MTAPTLVFGWGNPGRGDDALGPLLIERLEAERARRPAWANVDLLCDFQLQVEHALDLQGRARVLFVDASAAVCDAPFAVSPLAAGDDAEAISHALSPQAVMHVYERVVALPAPPCELLAIAGESFDLGAPLSPTASANLDAAAAWAKRWVSRSL